MGAFPEVEPFLFGHWFGFDLNLLFHTAGKRVRCTRALRIRFCNLTTSTFIGRQSYLVSSPSFSLTNYSFEQSFELNNDFIMFIENTKTHRVRIIWDKDEIEMSKAKAKAVYDFLEEFSK